MSLRRAGARPPATTGALDATELRAELEALAAVARRADATAVPIVPQGRRRPQYAQAPPEPGPPEDPMLLRSIPAKSEQEERIRPDADRNDARGAWNDDLDGDGWVRGCNRPDLEENKRLLDRHWGFQWAANGAEAMIDRIVGQLRPHVRAAAERQLPTFFIDGANMFGPGVLEPQQGPYQWHFFHGALQLGHSFWRPWELPTPGNAKPRGLCIVFLNASTADLMREDMGHEFQWATAAAWPDDQRVPQAKSSANESGRPRPRMLPWQCFRYALQGLQRAEDMHVLVVELRVDGLAFQKVGPQRTKKVYFAAGSATPGAGGVNLPRHEHGEIDDYILSRCFDKLYDDRYGTADDEVSYLDPTNRPVPGLNYQRTDSLSLFQIVSCDGQVYKGRKTALYCSSLAGEHGPPPFDRIAATRESNRRILEFVNVLVQSPAVGYDSVRWNQVMHNQSLPDKETAIRNGGALHGAVFADVYEIGTEDAIAPDYRSLFHGRPEESFQRWHEATKNSDGVPRVCNRERARVANPHHRCYSSDRRDRLTRAPEG